MKEYEKWFKKAESDLLTIENNLLAKNIPSDTCCFHAQHAAEKYLKAYLVSKNIIFPQTHDLEFLLRLCLEINLIFENIKVNTRSLYTYAIIPRYPDLSDDLTVEDAKQAYENALTIKQFILKHFFE